MLQTYSFYSQRVLPLTLAMTIALFHSFHGITQCNIELGFLIEPACPFQSDGVITVIPTQGTPPYQYYWENDTVFTNKLMGLDVGTYSVTVTDALDCSVVGSVILMAATRPEVQSEVQDASCFGANDGQLTIIAHDPSLFFKVGSLPASPQKEYNNLFPGGDQYFVIDTFGCAWVQFYFIDAPKKIVFDLPNSFEVPACDSVQIPFESPNQAWKLQWSPATFVSCMDCESPFVLPLNDTTFFLTITDTSGCQAKDSIRAYVDFQAQAVLPNAFTPNEDDLNDNFYVIGKCAEEVLVLRIFDRWGELVFEKSNTPPNDPFYGWNGKYKGKEANSDVYIYFAKVKMPDGREIELKGDLTLLR